MAENQEPVKVEEQGPFIHQLQLFFFGRRSAVHRQ